MPECFLSYVFRGRTSHVHDNFPTCFAFAEGNCLILPYFLPPPPFAHCFPRFLLSAICDTIISLYDENEAGHAPVVTSGMREQLQKRISSPVGFPNPTSTPTASTPTPMPARLPSAASPRPTPSPSPGYNPDTMPCRHSNGDTSSSMERERGVASGSRSGDMSARHADGDPRRRRSSASTSARSHSPSRSQGSPTKRKSWDGSASSLMNGAGGGVMREKLPSSGEEWVDVSTKRQRPL